MLISIIILILSPLAIFVLNQPKFGKIPRGKKMERIRKSPNFKNGQFQNLHETPRVVTSDKFIKILFHFLFNKKNNNKIPEKALKMEKIDLNQLPESENSLVWFGHSSYFMQIEGKRFLVDPVFFEASPFRWINKAFKGTRHVYRTKNIPKIDYYIITHDHWDHLDWNSVKRLKNRTGHFICGLGVGAHLEHWGVDPQKIIELDWWETYESEDGLKINCTPSRHFSGRGLRSDRSLWASYLLETPSLNIFMSGDGGYDTHFADIGNKWHIDWAILENGQYNEQWRYIHTMPNELAQEAKDLKAKHILTVHHSKYALAQHDWDEPLKNEEALEKEGFPVVHATLGGKIILG